MTQAGVSDDVEITKAQGFDVFIIRNGIELDYTRINDLLEATDFSKYMQQTDNTYQTFITYEKATMTYTDPKPTPTTTQPPTTQPYTQQTHRTDPVTVEHPTTGA